MASSFSRHLDADHILAAFVALCGWGGLLGIFLVVLVGFEEPDHTLLLGSCMLLAAVPIAVLVHLWRTKQLTRAQKRLWLRELTGRNAARAFSEYVSRSARHP
jgi:hypothetical protein